jgi:tRNA pseudouridine55 synthase
MAAPEGVLVVDKPAGWTSHDVVARCRRLAGTRKIGHAGTLDPMATGVLVLGLGRATRLLGYLAATTKTYEATVRLGESTTTDDAEGEPVDAADASALTDDQVEGAVSKLRGEILQTPSAVSAIKVDGKRAYARVRAGEDVALRPRAVRIDEFTVLATRRLGAHVDLDVRVRCSTGTYVRALARDLGAALGVGGHLTALRRTRVGAFRLERAHDLDSLAELDSADLPVVSLRDAAAASFEPVIVTSSDEVDAIRHGRPLQLDLGGASPAALFSAGGEFLALYEPHGPVAKAVAVFAPA